MQRHTRNSTFSLGQLALWFGAAVVSGQLILPYAWADSNAGAPRQVTVTLTRLNKDSAKEVVTAPRITVRPGQTADVRLEDSTYRFEVAVTANVVGGSPRHEISVTFARERDGKQEVVAAPRITVPDRIPAVVSMAQVDGGTIEVKATLSPVE